jgi:putative aldouronate transport system substrate-binding protein
MKKRSSWIVGILILLLTLTACGGNTASNNKKENATPSNETTAPAESEETVNLTMTYMVLNNPTDIDLIEQELNKLTKEKINATVDLVPIQLSNYNQQINLMMTSKEKMDLVMTGNLGSILTYAQQAPKGQLLAIDELLKEHGQGVLAALGDYATVATVGGKLYGVPTVRDLAADRGWAVRKDMVEKYNIELAAVQTLDDLEQQLAILKEGESIEPFGLGSGVTFVQAFYLPEGDALGDDFGVLLDMQDPELKVINYYETEEYKQLVTKARAWFQAGFIPKDIATTKDSNESLIKSGKILSFSATLKPGINSQMTNGAGLDMVTTPLTPVKADTQKVTSFMWGIPAHSEHADKAMQLLNLMYSDEAVYNLLTWGIEGKHYVKVDDTFINFPEGVDATNSGYNQNMGYAMGNQFLSYVWEGNNPNLWEETREYNKNAIPSQALGFMWDSSPVKTEYAAVVNVREQYRAALENGLVDPEKTLPEFLSKLKSAGIDKIIAEKQKQLDEWAQANK